MAPSLHLRTGPSLPVLPCPHPQLIPPPQPFTTTSLVNFPIGGQESLIEPAPNLAPGRYFVTRHVTSAPFDESTPPPPLLPPGVNPSDVFPNPPLDSTQSLNHLSHLSDSHLPFKIPFLPPPPPPPPPPPVLARPPPPAEERPSPPPAEMSQMQMRPSPPPAEMSQMRPLPSMSLPQMWRPPIMSKNAKALEKGHFPDAAAAQQLAAGDFASWSHPSYTVAQPSDPCPPTTAPAGSQRGSNGLQGHTDSWRAAYLQQRPWVAGRSLADVRHQPLNGLPTDDQESRNFSKGFKNPHRALGGENLGAHREEFLVWQLQHGQRPKQALIHTYRRPPQPVAPPPPPPVSPLQPVPMRPPRPSLAPRPAWGTLPPVSVVRLQRPASARPRQPRGKNVSPPVQSIHPVHPVHPAQHAHHAPRVHQAYPAPARRPPVSTTPLGWRNPQYGSYAAGVPIGSLACTTASSRGTWRASAIGSGRLPCSPGDTRRPRTPHPNSSTCASSIFWRPPSSLWPGTSLSGHPTAVRRLRPSQMPISQRSAGAGKPHIAKQKRVNVRFQNSLRSKKVR